MNRKGYTEMWYELDMIENGIANFDYDYIVIENVNFEKEFEYCNHILRRLKPLATNGKITLCEYSDTIVCNSVADFVVK
jgi:hypothetical protein